MISGGGTDGDSSICSLLAIQLNVFCIYNFNVICCHLPQKYIKILWNRSIRKMYILQQRVIMVNLRHINTMQQHICDTQHTWKLLFLNTINGIIVVYHWKYKMDNFGKEDIGLAN